MPNLSSRVALPALFALAACCQIGSAQVDPATLDTAKIQDRVGKYLASERGQLRVRLLAPLIAAPRAADLTYKKDATNQPESLTWRVQGAKSLTGQETRDVEQELKNILEQAFGDGLGEGKPFLTDANSKKVLAATKVTVDPQRQDATPSAPATTQLYQGWAPVCCYYGCSSYTYLVPVWYYGPAQAQAVAPTPVERQARMPAPAPKAKTPPALVAQPPAEKNFARAMDHFWRGERGAALVWLHDAVEAAPDDARVWSFKALAERSLGDTKAAHASAQRAAALQVLGRGPSAAVVAGSLEGLLEADRAFLNGATDGTMSKQVAQELVSVPVISAPASPPQRGGASVTRK